MFVKNRSDLDCEFEIKSENDGTFTGVASTSDTDSQNDVISPGAFDPIPLNHKTGQPDVLMLRDHDRSQVIGGWESFQQSGRRLLVKGQLCLEVEKARETYALMKRGFLTGLSVGFNIAKDSITYDGKSGRRFIRKATLRECSIVALPANNDARIADVKSEDIADWLAAHGLKEEDIRVLERDGFDALIESHKASDPKKPWGDVEYADPGYQEDGVHRYPIDVERRIRSAWSYINMERNQAPYTREQVERIKARIIAAWKRKIDPDGPPAHQDSKQGNGTIPSGMRKPREDESRDSWMSYCMGELSGEGFTGDERLAVCMRAYREGERPRTTKGLILGIDGHYPLDDAQVLEQLRSFASKAKGLSYGR